MNYETVMMEEKCIAGVSARTGNDDPAMGEIIGGLWKSYYGEGIIGRIQNRANEYAIGLYSDYTADGYAVTVGCEAGKEQPECITVKVLPAGRYAKFSIHGNMVTAVQEAWSEIWQMELDRSYTGDYEEYLNSDENNNSDINLYIALK